MTTIRSSRELFGERPNAVYDVLTYLEPGLMLDVGAAAGSMTEMMLARSPLSNAIAYEPFPGNHPFIERRLGADDRVTIVKAAVGDAGGDSAFFVGSTVSGSEAGWERFRGFSAVGYLVSEASATDDGRTIVVPTVRIDDQVGDRHVRFMKVDVQGGELGVLQSAGRCIAGGRIDLMFVEFGGERDVLAFLLESGFDVFDSEYLLIADDPPDPSWWYAFSSGTLSVGRQYFRAWPVDMPTDPDGYCEMFSARRAPRTFVYTDLVCVRRGFLTEYSDAATLARQAASSSVEICD